MNSLFQVEDINEVADPIIRETQRQFLTAVSRSHAFQLERQGLFPKHIELGSDAIGWRLSEILAWVRSRPVVELGNKE
ncbi:AlpA family transcriptional regulator [Shewanella sp. NIFS-20-20]|uniref:helix-turn-helix transcriptional regulator n=1 Tax=Shewanella sp. NIFS-20-20 TaxID=2853806 RepID=UPI001C47145C|nr:AlpA family phage regulatory protein [Shewanella sp. NIFS-20-20]MBV7317347.1 AlpA family transcriptional regulator [Shewanella sp. NIFS-20-20]